METVNLKDLIIPRAGYQKHVTNIIKNFKNVIRREIPRRQEQNLRKLTSLFLNDVNTRKPIVVNLDIGQGKSLLLQEFIKYIYQVDASFSSIIVKRTLREGRDFCIEVGLQDKKIERDIGIGKRTCDFKTELEKLYYGDIEDYKMYGRPGNRPREDLFIAKLLRGFNYKDCLEYKDPKSFKLAFGKASGGFYQEYSPALCRYCHRKCNAKLSKWTVNDHPAMVITHQRLFLSNDIDNIIGDISGRQVLIVDEKLQTVDIGNILFDEWEATLDQICSSNISDEVKEEAKSIGLYLASLEYPNSSEDGVIIQKPHQETFEFSPSIYGVLRNGFKHVQTLDAVEKFINHGGTTSRVWNKKNKKQVSYVRHIDMENYSRHFQKTIILDATSARNGEILDDEYRQSDVVFLGGLNKTRQGKVNIFYSSQRTTKSAMINSGRSDKNKFRNYSGNTETYKHNIELLAHEVGKIISDTRKRTLIICYKSIVDRWGKEFPVKDDLLRAFNSLKIDPTLYSIRHFGAATTGVNDFRNFESIVFIGMLDKGRLYYANKTVAINNSNFQDTQYNEYLIDCVQQIGRVCIREGKKVNVYLLFEDYKLVEKLSNYYSTKVKPWLTLYYDGINNATLAKKNTCWFAVIGELRKMEHEEKLPLKKLQELLRDRYKADTI